MKRTFFKKIILNRLREKAFQKILYKKTQNENNNKSGTYHEILEDVQTLIKRDTGA